MIRKKIQQVKRLVSDVLAFQKLKRYQPVANEKTVVVHVQNPNIYHRFFYLLLKFYELAGYTIYYPMDFARFRNLRNKDRYLGLIVREKDFLSIQNKDFPSDAIVLEDTMFSPDYFNSYFNKNNQEEDCFHVPMSFHPFMYHQGIWNNMIDLNKKRVNSIFCYGNFDSKAYLEIKRTGFSVIPRTELLEFFSNQENFMALPGKKETLEKIKDHSLDQKYAFAIKENFALAMEDVRELLSYFNFYLCCPGVVMPLCHNVIEAMSVGTIPLIQKEYAEVMYPHLQHRQNAIVFEDLPHLEHILSEEIFHYSEPEISAMRNNVLDYYEQYLTPEGMVKNLNESIQKHQLIYLQAEHRSVTFIN